MSTKGKVVGIVANLVTIEVDGPVAQNEICYIDLKGTKLMAEVIKITGKNAYVQVFESTRGLYVGCDAEFTGNMLEVTLGPGMLSRNYDGLQNDLAALATNWQMGVDANATAHSPPAEFARALASVGLGAVQVPEPMLAGMTLVVVTALRRQIGRRLKRAHPPQGGGL